MTETTQKKGELSPLSVPPRNTSMVAGSFNLIKSAVGTGILTLPKSIANCGLYFGVVILAFCSLATTSTLHFLSRVAANTDQGDYFAIGKLAYGNLGEIFSVIATLFYLIGGLIGYSVFAGRFIRTPLAVWTNTKNIDSVWYFSMPVVVTACAILIFPIACLRDLSKLAKASIVGMICMTLICGLTVFDYFFDSPLNPPTINTIVFSTSAIRGFSNMVFAFCNHFTMLAIVPQFVNPTPKRRAILTGLSSTVVFIFYLLVSVFGYLHFGEGVSDIVLLVDSRKTSNAYCIAQLLVAAVIICSYPLLCDPAKSCFDFLVTKVIGPTSPSTAGVRNITITATLVGFSALVGMFFYQIVLPILGAFTSLWGSFLMFIFPAAFFLKLGGKYRVSPLEKSIAYAVLVLGVALMIFGTYFNVIECYDALKALRPPADN